MKPFLLASACLLSLTAFGCSSSSSGNTAGGDSGPPPADGGGGDSGNPADGTVGDSTVTEGGPGDSGHPSEGGDAGTTGNNIKTIFLILMENHNWSSIMGSSSAPYINGTLLPAASWCTQYFDNPNADHPSEPNYIWLEAATDHFTDNQDTFSCDCDPSPSNSTAATGHLATMLAAKGLKWREYAEDISGSDCAISSSGLYATKHVPFVFFQDVSGNPPSSGTAGCQANVRPYTELATDLTSGNVAQYNFITPNLCNDMHGAGGCPSDDIATGDTWLSQQIPMIQASNAYKNGGAIFITWDESEGGELPIGMIVLSPLAKGNNYQSTIKYYHSSMVRTVEEVFGLTPLINDAANQKSLSDLFTKYP